MALIVEDGSGKPDAESYISVSFADNYFANRGIDAWAALSVPRKEQVLRIASDYVSNTFRRGFVGRSAYVNQALEWPRIINGQIVGTPLQVGQAVAEFALAADTQNLSGSQERQQKKVKVGPIEVEYDNASQGSPQFANALNLLSRWLSGGYGQLKLTRV